MAGSPKKYAGVGQPHVPVEPVPIEPKRMTPSTGHILDGRFRDGAPSADHPDQTASARVRAPDSFVRSTPFRTMGRVVEGNRPHSTILPVSAVFVLDKLSGIGSIAIWHLFRYHKQQSVSE